MFDWYKAFTNSNVNDMVNFCPKTIQNKLSNYISPQAITFMTRILHGLILKLNLNFRRKIKFTKIVSKIVIIHNSKENWKNIYRTA